MTRLQQAISALGLCAICATAAACASAEARGADSPGLVIPPPPAHVVPITAEPVLEPVGESPTPPASGTARPPARPPAPRPATGEAKPEAKPSTTDPKADQPPPSDSAAPVVPVAPAPQLRTPESTGAEAAIHASIDRARGLLNTVDYRHLNNARRRAYDDAKTFAQQAEDALKAGNVVFAQSVATKAETLAKQLAGG
jgi:hypothetical protein